MKNLFIIYHGRFPGEKAASLFAAKEAESLTPHARVVLMVPRRLGRERADPYGYYEMSKEVRIVYLPTLDLFYIPLLSHIAFLVSYVFFSLACLLYLLFCIRREDAVITNEALPAWLATVVSRRVVFEVHDFPARWHWFYTSLFKLVHTVLCTNEWKRVEILKHFAIPTERLVVERNGVQVETFGTIHKDEARRKLGLDPHARLVVYTGHLYAYKGIETLAEAARLVPDATFVLVGGTLQDQRLFTQRFSAVPNIRLMGQRPHADMPLWQAAADVLVLPNSGEEDLSARYTSPMKLFEYMASERPIVASRVPAIEEVLTEDAAYLVEPDSAGALAGAIQEVLRDEREAQKRSIRARQEAGQYSWTKRADRLLARLH